MTMFLLFREAMLALRPRLARAGRDGLLVALTPAPGTPAPSADGGAAVAAGKRGRGSAADNARPPVHGPRWDNAEGLRPAPPSKRARLKRAFGLAGRLVLYAHLAFIAATSLLVVVYARVDPPVTVLALSRKYLDGWAIAKPRPVALTAVPKTVRRMLVSIEDSKFWTHFGIDPEAIKRAATINKDVGRLAAGGSTLTMQTARTLFLTPVKSYLRKYLEAIVTIELELFLSKERIMELYFSWAEWGKGVFGIEAAARKYYGKSVSALGLDEAARLVAILSSPVRYTPFTLAKRGQLKWRYDYLIKKYGG